jgi:hypothetical protein
MQRSRRLSMPRLEMDGGPFQFRLTITLRHSSKINFNLMNDVQRSFLNGSG